MIFNDDVSILLNLNLSLTSVDNTSILFLNSLLFKKYVLNYYLS